MEKKSARPIARRILVGGALAGVILGVTDGDEHRLPRPVTDYRQEFAEFFTPGSVGNANSRPLLNQEILDAQREYFLKNREYLRQAYRDSRTVIDLGDRNFVASIVRGNSDAAVVSAAEYGNPLNRLGVVRHLGVRALVDPGAAAVYLPANIHGQNNLNYSTDERGQLERGDSSPFTRRVEAALAYAGVRGAVHGYGISQSADFMPAWAACTDHDVQSLSLTETPFLEGQLAPDSMLRVALSSDRLEDYYKLSRQGITDEALTNDGAFSLADFVRGAMFDDDNRAMLSYMNARQVEQDLGAFRTARPDAGLTMIWGGVSRVSPHRYNRAIARQLGNDRAEYFEAYNADHVMTNAYAVVAAGALRAKLLAA